MGRKCSTIFNNETCKSGYKTAKPNYRVLSFPADENERSRWLMSLPNQIENATDNMGVCVRHWPEHYEFKTIPGGHKRPVNPPSIFGDTPKSLQPQTSKSADRCSERRRVTYEERMKTTARITKSKDKIDSWDNLCNYCRKVGLAIETSEHELRLIKLNKENMMVDFSILIEDDFKVSAFKGSKSVNIREVVDRFTVKLSHYSQINAIVDYLNNLSFDVVNELKRTGNDLLMLINAAAPSDPITDDPRKLKQIHFLSRQLTMHGTKLHGHRFGPSDIRDALELFLRSRNAYNALRRDYLILPADQTLKSYFGKLNSPGSYAECENVVKNVFSSLDGLEKCCFISADEIYVKAAVRYRGNRIIGFAVDQDPDVPPQVAKTILALMINFIYKTLGFIARLLPCAITQARIF